MLIQLLPEQVSNVWETYKKALYEAHPPFMKPSPLVYSRLLEGALSGKIHCWVATDKEQKPRGLAITDFTYDYWVGLKMLLIFMVWSNGAVSKGIWEDGFRTLYKFAQVSGCHKIIAYSNNKTIIELAKVMGGRAEMVLCEWEVVH